MKATEAINKNSKQSPYYKNYKKLIEYIDNIQYSEEFFELRIQKFITKYVKKINDFEEKINISIKIKDNEREEEIRTKLQVMKLFLLQYEDRSKSVFDEFEKSLKKKLESDLENLIIKSEVKTLLEANRLIDECHLEGSMSLRKNKIKKLVEYEIQPLIKVNINELSDNINKNFKKSIDEEVEILKRNLEVITLGIESDFFKSNLIHTEITVPNMFDLREFNNMILTSLGIITGIVGIIVAPALITALIPATIVGAIIGMLGTLASMVFGLQVVGWLMGPVDKIRDKITQTMKSKMKNKMDSNIPNIYKNVKANINVKLIISNIRRGIFEEFESKVAQKLEPYEIAVSNYDSEEIAIKFQPVLDYITSLRININALNTVFVRKANEKNSN